MKSDEKNIYVIYRINLNKFLKNDKILQNEQKIKHNMSNNYYYKSTSIIKDTLKRVE